ncbi:hypothetical protein CEXT_64751 [Caerostris extrusa]|uniref:Uncharacterized protein n=1 Tax=Caerostris extrusa TaxID=172846 RepID=A0AAV4RIK0_CAEEX|nr:hypothetical protein CEXT_64751 [Caerostris extrusa]
MKSFYYVGRVCRIWLEVLPNADTFLNSELGISHATHRWIAGELLAELGHDSTACLGGSEIHNSGSDQRS